MFHYNERLWESIIKSTKPYFLQERFDTFCFSKIFTCAWLAWIIFKYSIHFISASHHIHMFYLFSAIVDQVVYTCNSSWQMIYCLPIQKGSNCKKRWNEFLCAYKYLIVRFYLLIQWTKAVRYNFFFFKSIIYSYCLYIAKHSVLKES